MIQFDDDAYDAIQALFDDSSREQLADRLDKLLDELEADPGEARFRRSVFQHDPALFGFSVSGSGETWTILWENASSGPFVHFAGTGLD